ncbi:MAG TPA: hypothetical protein VI056_00065 [Candidatus Limnocylindria bacterium]
MNSTETTPAPADGGRQVGQVLAGRYRLAMFKGGDDLADLWHALDDSSEKVVTLEILRDRSNEPARQRFLAEARRMAAIERPSVMRVASIHDGATDTFIVFDHLIPLPVVMTELSAIAKDVKPATKAADERTTVLGAMAGPTRPPVAPEPVATLQAAIDAIEAVDETPASNFETAAPGTPAASASTTGPTQSASAVSGALATAKSDVAAVVAEVRALLPQGIDTSALTSFITRASARMRRVAGAASSVRGPSSSPASAPPRAADVKGDARQTAGTGAAQSVASLGTRVASSAAPFIARAASNAAPLIARVASSAGPLMARAASNAGPLVARAASGTGPLIARISRVHPVILAIPIGLLLLGIFVLSPLDDAIVEVLRGAPSPSATGVPRPALAPAPFTVPPLSAYGAAFESQGPYPTTTPNGTVEWVVALRNTGSAGWYRGIEGAQAALALPNGAGVAVQTTEYVAPGQVGWFVVKFRARAELGTYNVQLLPRIDGRGPLQDLGIYTVVTVSQNP